MIRDAKVGDFPDVLELCKRLRGQIETYPGAEVDRESVLRVFGQCVGSRMNKALVAEHDGRLTGLMLGITQELWWSRSREATDLVLYSERPGDGLRMVRRFVEWAFETPRVVSVTLAQSSGLSTDRSTAILKRLGFTEIGGIAQLVKPDARAGAEILEGVNERSR